MIDAPTMPAAAPRMLTACMLGQRFAIVTLATALGPWYAECVAAHGLSGRCAGIRLLDRSFRDVGAVQEEKEGLLVDLALRAVSEDRADAVILAGAPLAGLAPRVAARLPVPVVDPIAAAVKQAEALVALDPRKARAGTFRRPPPEPKKGLPKALGQRIAHEGYDRGDRDGGA